MPEYVDMSPEGDPLPIRAFSKISRNYREKGSFIIDFITLIPFYQILSNINPHIMQVYIIKVLRLYNSIEYFNVSVIMKAVK